MYAATVFIISKRKELSIKCKGNGGGSKQFAQGGGSHAEDISKYLSEIKDDIKNVA